MQKQIIHSEQAPKVIGPYSQATAYEGMLYCSGQIPLDPVTMEIVGKTAAEQTKQVMENMGQVLKAAGSDYSKILKCTIFVKDLNEFANINEVYRTYFSENPPARSTIEVSRLPKDSLVEIECIAHT